MQKLPDSPPEAGRYRFAIRPGALVRVRRERWRVTEVRAYEDCALITLAGLSAPHAGVERRVVAPFDLIEPTATAGDDAPPLFVRRQTWRRACRALLADDAPPASLRCARAAKIDLLPHQLEPALAVLRGVGSRVLIADEVGLGKSIQAGLVLAELRARGAIDRVLVLAPSGLRDQWTNELSSRFALPTTLVDAAMLRRRAATLPIGVNPWSTVSTTVASVDFVKRPEVLPAVADVRWDVIVVDEAHGVAGDSERRTAVRALASRASYVLLLTATPHSGDRASFAALCDLGSLDDDPLVVFRRTRATVRPDAARRVHALTVRLGASERRMHARLLRYGDAIRAERPGAWLGLSVLHKRANSSPWALAQSVERRLSALAALTAQPRIDGNQLALPLGDSTGEFAEADVAPCWPAEVGLSDADIERRLLIELAASARTAAPSSAKVSALRRLLRRAGEPAVVFTEYRDTLLHLQRLLNTPRAMASALHGGLTRAERADVLHDFAGGRFPVLLATDAAGEGLNLHGACRLIVNLELPWNPMRLEQRIGRVDRIGQTRTVHAFHLIAGDTGEPAILLRLRERIACARADLGAPDPVGGADEERAIARFVVTGETQDADRDHRSEK